MIRDTTQRQYSYLKHRDNALVEVLGQMKKRVPIRESWTGPACEMGRSLGLIEPARQALAKKIAESYQEVKGILPVGRTTVNVRPCSIKIVNRQHDNGMTGAYYLMQKSQTKGHAERKHISESHTQERSSRQKRHYAQPAGGQDGPADPQANRKTSTQLRVFNDLMSSIPDNDYHRKERPSTAGGHIQKRNTMHRTSQEIGLHYTKPHTISEHKRAEIAGNGLDKEPVNLKHRRDDYRKSSIVLG